MKRKLKRAFTIVELVIVIAVIAVLAAVLIPTFVSLVDRANQSSDISAARNMNSALVNDEAINGKPTKLTDVLHILEEAGMDANQYKALAKDRKLVWDAELNRVLYVSDSDNKVLFPEEYTNIVYDDDFFGRWITLTGQMAGDDSWLSNSNVETTEVQYTSETGTETTIDLTDYEKYQIGSAAQLVSLSEELRTNPDFTDTSNVYIELRANETIDLRGAEWQCIAEFQGIFNGNGATIKGFAMTDATQNVYNAFAASTGYNYCPYGFMATFSGKYFGKVTFEGVDIDNPGDTSSNNHTTAVAVGAVLAPDEGQTVVIDQITVSGNVVGAYRVGGVVGYVGGSSGSQGVQAVPMKGKVIISNCTNNAKLTSLGHKNFASVGGIVSTSNQRAQGSSLTIVNCKNYGTLQGAAVGGIMANFFCSNTKEENSAGVSGTITIESCTSEADLIMTRTGDAVKDTQNVLAGGIIAYSHDKGYTLNIKNCNVSGNITSEGIADTDSLAYCGTIIGYIAGGGATGTDSCIYAVVTLSENSGSMNMKVEDGIYSGVTKNTRSAGEYNYQTAGESGTAWLKSSTTNAGA